MDLRQSIGKSRGEFVLPMIPTRDFQMKEDSDDSDEEWVEVMIFSLDIP